MTEAEAAARISRAQKERDVYLARQAQREKALTELAQAINIAVTELRSPVTEEILRRTEIIGKRVTEALQVGKAVDPRMMSKELSALLHFSGPIQAAWALLPNSTIVHPGNNEALMYSAKQILTKFQQIISEAEKKL